MNFGNMQKGIPDIAAGNPFVVLRRRYEKDFVWR